MKKLTLLALCATLLLSAFAGCAKETEPTPGGGNSPGETASPSPSPSPSTSPETPPAGNIEGDPSDIIQRIYDAYNNREDVKSALAQLEESAPRREELLNRINEIYNDLFADGITEEETEQLNAELAALEEERYELSAPERLLLSDIPPHPLTAEGTGMQSVSWFLGDGNENLPYTEAAVSEPMMGGGYSLVVLRMEEGADIEDAKTRIKNGKVGDWPMNQKWVCMGVDASDFIVDNIGGLIVVIISDKSAELHESFLSLAK